MAQRIEKCGKGTRFILGGYSQGGQVIGQAYTERFSDALRDRVVFNVLLGDPKLWLPEGDLCYLKLLVSIKNLFLSWEWCNA